MAHVSNLFICTQQSYCSLSLSHSSLLCPKVTWFRAGWVRESSPARDPIPPPGRRSSAGRRPLILPPPFVDLSFASPSRTLLRLSARRCFILADPPVAALLEALPLPVAASVQRRPSAHRRGSSAPPPSPLVHRGGGVLQPAACVIVWIEPPVVALFLAAGLLFVPPVCAD